VRGRPPSQKKTLWVSPFAQIRSVNDCYDLDRGNIILERERMLACPLQSCTDSVGISLLCDWDVFAFVYRHVTSLTSADHIARLVGYESKVVGRALDRLESQKLIERSRPSRGVRFYRVLTSRDVEHRRCLRELVTLSESRAGRLELAKRLSPARSGWVREEPSV
jgi:DNA-binding MarR family transcriptional regulator